MESKRITVRGRVQGVGFRAYVVSTALVHGAVGEVWNSRDGSVEIISMAPTLDGFIAAMRWGPGRVDGVDVYDHPEIDATSFRVTQTR